MNILNAGVTGMAGLPVSSPAADGKPGLYGEVLSTLQDALRMQDDRVRAMYADMKARGESARDTLEMANEVGLVLAKYDPADQQGRQVLPDPVRRYMESAGITVSGQSVDDFLKAQGATAEGVTKPAMLAIQSALKLSADRDQDAVTLQTSTMQRVCNGYAMLQSLLTTMQTMFKELNSEIIRALKA